MRRIPLGHLALSAGARNYVNDAMSANRLSAGPYTKLFEQRFAALHGCNHAIFMNSGTSALITALHALKIKHGFKDGAYVLVPSVTFVATINAVLHCQLRPVFVDVSPDTFLMEPVSAEHASSIKGVVAAIPVHLFGLPFDCRDINSKCKIVEDSCEAMFVEAGGKKVGSMGDFGCFSTYVSHVLTTGVGGLVTCNDPDNAKLIRSLMCHGRDHSYLNIDDDDDALKTEDFAKIVKRRFLFPHIGWSFRATELEAAIGCAALEEHEVAVAQRALNARDYRKHLSKHDCIRIQKVSSGSQHANMLFPIALRSDRKNPWLGRDHLMLALEKRGVETRTAMPLLNQPCYRDLFGINIEKEYPVAHWLNQCGLCLPCHEGMCQDDVNYVCDIIDDFIKGKV